MLRVHITFKIKIYILAVLVLILVSKVTAQVSQTVIATPSNGTQSPVTPLVPNPINVFYALGNIFRFIMGGKIDRDHPLVKSQTNLKYQDPPKIPKSSSSQSPTSPGILPPLSISKQNYQSQFNPNQLQQQQQPQPQSFQQFYPLPLTQSNFNQNHFNPNQINQNQNVYPQFQPYQPHPFQQPPVIVETIHFYQKPRSSQNNEPQIQIPSVPSVPPIPSPPVQNLPVQVHIVQSAPIWTPHSPPATLQNYPVDPTLTSLLDLQSKFSIPTSNSLQPQVQAQLEPQTQTQNPNQVPILQTAESKAHYVGSFMSPVDDFPSYKQQILTQPLQPLQEQGQRSSNQNQYSYLQQHQPTLYTPTPLPSPPPPQPIQNQNHNQIQTSQSPPKNVRNDMLRGLTDYLSKFQFKIISNRRNDQFPTTPVLENIQEIQFQPYKLHRNDEKVTEEMEPSSKYLNQQHQNGQNKINENLNGDYKNHVNYYSYMDSFRTLEIPMENESPVEFYDEAPINTEGLPPKSRHVTPAESIYHASYMSFV